MRCRSFRIFLSYWLSQIESEFEVIPSKSKGMNNEWYWDISRLAGWHLASIEDIRGRNVLD